ncbi:type II toxin-antitoxin system RelE/ParE family toxin [Pedobacter gandavensis]|uniref:type II toxin-antitoxin system RelE/ParE family toxin n=1 Tax=Pedobacter TaxID=84567 RepID=UPI001657522C|nr:MULTISPECIES: type II toxin-antitoxin system RelE/ParE family toxin [Pedobacter]MBC8988451.1 type II toxin-antitoxin system RelE/ParE family toxin [Pedobacter sp. N36a]WGQ10659.1 type II toxin-antitoxin system RelE/ParE family toxin [Pedobacter gandavensis]
MAFEVLLTPDFKRELKQIAKKHKQILKDLNGLIDELIENPTMGTDLGQNVYKIRLAISSTNKGKSGGARVITYVYIEGETIYLSEIYLKSEHDTVDIKAVIERLHNEGFI